MGSDSDPEYFKEIIKWVCSVKAKMNIAIIMCLCFSSAAYADVFKCKSAGGAIEYMDKPCPGSSSEVNIPKPASP